MPQRDTIDFVAAFAVGALAGVAIGLLLKPEPAGRVERIRQNLRPYERRVRKGVRRARKGFGKGVDAAAELGSALGEAGRELLHDLRSEMREIVATARDDIARTFDEQIKKAQKSVRRGGLLRR